MARARYVRLGRINGFNPSDAVAVSSNHALVEDGLVIGNVYGDPSLRAKVIRNPLVHGRIGRSRAAVRRQSADPSWFISGDVEVAALFIDTDGRRVQDGDDF